MIKYQLYKVILKTYKDTYKLFRRFLNRYNSSFILPSPKKSIDYLNLRLLHSNMPLPFYPNVLSTRYKNLVVVYPLNQLYLLAHRMNYLCLAFIRTNLHIPL